MMPNGGHEMRFCLERSNRCAPQEDRAPQVHRQPVDPHRQRWQTIIERIIIATDRDHGINAFDLLFQPARERERPTAPLQQAQWNTLKEIGRASCRERVGQYVLISVVAAYLKKKE